MNTLKKITSWNELSIGNEDVDQDHQRLLEIYNELVDLVELKKTREDFARILSMMTDYSLIHFRKEEVYMENFSYPKLDEHKKYHNNYIYSVSMYNANLLGPNPPDPIEIVMFLKKWWQHHILQLDIEYEIFKRDNQFDIQY
jgi:hemerythrin